MILRYVRAAMERAHYRITLQHLRCLRESFRTRINTDGRGLDNEREEIREISVNPCPKNLVAAGAAL